MTIKMVICLFFLVLSPSFDFVLFSVQLPMGDGDQGCHEEVPKPHEP